MNDNASVPVPFMDMPGCQWFWDNYNKCVQWQENHQLAYYKAKITGLQFENDLLHKQMLYLAKQNDQLIVQNQSLVNGVNPGFLLDSHSFHKWHQDTGCLQPQVDYYNSSQYSTERMNVCPDINSDDDNDGGFDFELCEGYLKYMEISYRHKMEMKKLREENPKGNGEKEEDEEDGVSSKKEVSGSVCDKVPTLHRKEQRLKELSLLYGEAAPKIHAMETAIQLSFNKNTDLLQPILWPNIGLNC